VVQQLGVFNILTLFSRSPIYIHGIGYMWGLERTLA